MTRLLLIALLIATAFGQSAPASSPPEQFEYYLSHGLGGTEKVSWEKGKLVLVGIPRYTGGREVTEQLEPSPQAWEQFWRAVDAASVWKWQVDYPSPIEIYDAEGWGLEMRHAGHSLKSHGYNNQPPGFAAFRDALDRLIKDSRSSHRP